MRRFALCLGLLLVPSSAWASAFTVLSIENHIIGRAGNDLGIETFDLTSPHPLSFEVDTDPDGPLRHSMAAASADGTTVYVAYNQGDDVSGAAVAISTVTFRSTFSGLFDGLQLEGINPAENSGLTDPDLGKAFWTLVDLTTSTTLVMDSDHNAQGAPVQTNLLVDWNASDIYQLMFGVQGGANQQPDSGFLTTNLKTVNTREPSTMCLLWLAILGLSGLRGAVSTSEHGGETLDSNRNVS